MGALTTVYAHVWKFFAHLFCAGRVQGHHGLGEAHVAARLTPLALDLFTPHFLLWRLRTRLQLCSICVLYVCVYVCMYVYTYQYEDRQAERQTHRQTACVPQMYETRQTWSMQALHCSRHPRTACTHGSTRVNINY